MGGGTGSQGWRKAVIRSPCSPEPILNVGNEFDMGVHRSNLRRVCGLSHGAAYSERGCSPPPLMLGLDVLQGCRVIMGSVRTMASVCSMWPKSTEVIV